MALEFRRSVRDKNRLHVYAVSLGCPKNRVDTETLLGELLSGGFNLTLDPSHADLIIINTCGFIREARDESMQVISEMQRKRKIGAKIAVVGCMAGLFRKEIESAFPNVDFILDSRQMINLRNILLKGAQGSLLDRDETLLPRLITTPYPYAYLKVSEGCSRRCAFCIIPKIKGRQKSRRPEEIVEEANSLTRLGVREIILVAQDLTSYGRDIGKSLSGLVRLILDQTKDLHWLRLLYLYPKGIDDDLLGVFVEDERCLPYFDIPVQHGDDRILSLMRRGTKAKELLELVCRIRELLPNAVLRTTYLVGFPSESEQEFENLLRFAQEARFEMAGVFAFSQEPNTYAEKMKDQVPWEVRIERKHRLEAYLSQLAHMTRGENSKIGKGTMHEAVVEDVMKGGKLKGRLWFQSPEIDGQVFIKGKGRVGEFIRVRILKSIGSDFIAERI